jgi:hypothetical protein
VSIRFRCPSCQSQLSISNDKAGSIATCPRCRSQIQVPHVALPVQETPPDPFQQVDLPSFTSVDSHDVSTHKARTRKRKPTTLVASGITCLFFIILGGMFWLMSRPIAGNKAVGSQEGQPGGIRLIPAVQALFSLSPEQEVVKRYVLRSSLNPDVIRFEKWFPAKDVHSDDNNAFTFNTHVDMTVQKRLVELANIVNSPNFGPNPPQRPPAPIGIVPGTDQVVLPGGVRTTTAKYRKLDEEYQRMFSDYQTKCEEARSKLEEYKNEYAVMQPNLYISEKVMTADRVVRVVMRTNIPNVMSIRTDDFYYLKNGKVVKSVSGTPADQDKLIDVYYPGED